ncbi:YheC/YheD family protein [Metabacillus indicus]|uniref:YheC/YheD family endospore coat-associated protein n=1 Tax=Metabacillus indicus TaxID=246786 RepID=UPI00068C85E2|nr:YheC/YheD family protein [Metabacillus indicus]
MITEKIQIRAARKEQPGRCIYISRSLREALNIPSGARVRVMCGRNSLFAQFVSIREEHSLVSVHPELLNALALPMHPFACSMTYDPRVKTVKLGPVIAVLTECEKAGLPQSLGKMDGFCRELASCSLEKGVLFYVFDLSGFEESEMRGYTLFQDKWLESSVPFPDAVHNRLHSRALEQSDVFMEMSSHFIRERVPYFNDRFLNKWEVHQILSQAGELAPHLPRTELLASKGIFEMLVRLFPVVFLKPASGSLGRRIFRISQTDDGYELDYSTFSGHLLRHYVSADELFKSLYPRIKEEAFIIQEGISLLTFQDRPLDFRILCHKRNMAEWAVTSAVARVSAENQFVANLARGGSQHPIKRILEESFASDDAFHIRKLLNELSIEISKALSMYAGGLFGEFGVDLAVDLEGRPWIIEVNTKPSKHQDDRTAAGPRPSARAIIDYSLFLCQTGREKDESGGVL